MTSRYEDPQADDRLRALLDLSVSGARTLGLSAYDGQVQDLSPAGVRAGLARLGGPDRHAPLDEALLSTAEAGARYELGELEVHRWNPAPHLANLDLSDYDRPGLEPDQRAALRRAHVAAWPDAVDAALAALDTVPATVAAALLPSAQALTADLEPHERHDAAMAAHQRFVERLQWLAAHSEAEAALGSATLTRWLSVTEQADVDLGDLAVRADAEITRLRGMLDDAARALEPGRTTADVVTALRADFPGADEVLDEARAVTGEVRAWVDAAGLVPEHDGECWVGPAPGSKAHVTAMLEPAGPFAPDAPSRYLVTPPHPSWSPADRDAWLEVFNRASLPAITVHEVAPGHFTHFRVLRQVAGPVRKVCLSEAFIEGWAHDMEELLLEEGFRSGDPRYQVGVALEALIRAVRLAAAVGVHSGTMTVEEAERRFTDQAFLERSAARSEAARAAFDPTYGRYTWGKLAIRALRERAQREWGAAYTHRRFHAALLSLGAPPLGLMEHALADG